MFSFGTSNVLWKFPHEKFSVPKIIVLRASVSSLLFGIIAMYQNNIQGSLNDWGIAIFICVISFFGLFFYNKSIKYSEVSHSITVTSFSAVFGVFTSVIFYDECLSWNLVLALVLLISSLFLLEEKKPIISWSKGTLFALMASFFWGTTFALFRIPVNKIGEINFSFTLEATVLLCSAIFLLFQKKNNKKQSATIKMYLIIALIGVLGFLGVIFYNKAVQIVEVSILSVMGAFTPVITIAIAHFLLRERFRFWQYIGMTLALLAVLILII